MIEKSDIKRIQDKVKDLQIEIKFLLESDYNKDNFNILWQLGFNLIHILEQLEELETK